MQPPSTKHRGRHTPEEYPTQQGTPGRAPGALCVRVWDARESRRALVSRVVAECGAEPDYAEADCAEAAGGPSAFASRRGGIALIALDAGRGSAGASLEAGRALKRADCEVVYYGDGSCSWPIAQRCRALLAGCAQLLDSAEPDFESKLRGLLARLLESQATRGEDERRVRETMERLGIIGRSIGMLDVFRWVLRLSPLSDLPVLLTGETGTGKELLANAIYRLDPKRRAGPFVVLNCGAVSQGLAESDLFGHRRGSFTGAEESRKGLVRAAQGGVLFLDEVGELEASLQTKLLRVLQERRVLGVGEEHEMQVDVRVVAATNRNLGEMVRRGEFRADLFHRLNILSVHIPPLRERPDDLKPLVNHFLFKHRALCEGAPAAATTTGDDFIEALADLGLPGNARELENIVRRALIGRSGGPLLGLEDLPPESWRQLSEREDEAAAAGVEPGVEACEAAPGSMPKDGSQIGSFFTDLLSLNGWGLSGALEYCEKRLLESALQRARGNQSQMARLLGITPRSIYNKLHKHQLQH